MIATLASSFLPVRDPAAAAAWYRARFGLDVAEVGESEAFRDACLESGLPCSPVQGDPATCLFLTTSDEDGNTVLVVDR